VDFDPERFRKIIFSHGMRVTWEQASECPCIRSKDELLAKGDGLVSELTAAGIAALTAEPRPECPVCAGKGYLYHSAQEIRATATGAQSNPQAFTAYGEYARGMLSFSLLPEHLPSYQDRFTLLDSVLVYRETQTRTAAVLEPLRYPVVSRDLDLEGGVTSVDVLYLIRTDPDGLPPFDGSGVMTKGVDFAVGAGGEIDWTLGDAGQTAPVEGAHYSVAYYAHPRYVVIDHPHVYRDTWIGKKVVDPYFQSLTVNAMGQLDFLGGGD